VRALGNPVKLSGTAAAGEKASELRRGAPQLGEHTRAVLAEEGWSDEEVNRLVAAGKVQAL
jgi:crotonobetainyl-CoA:carnitine CoA-transferase CaiB-like acyl-CoA transferase